MKILYIAAFNYPSHNAATKRINNIIKSILSKDVEVTILSAKSPSKIDEEISIQGIEIKFLPNLFSNKSFYLKFINSLVHFFYIVFFLIQHRMFTHIILYSGYSVYALAVLFTRIFNKFSAIFDAVEWNDQRYLGLKKLRSIDINFCMKNLLFYFDGIICISQFLENYYRKGTNIKKLPKVINLPPLEDSSSKEKIFDLTDDSEIKIIYSGQIGENKDQLQEFLQAFLLIKKLNLNFTFTIVGDNHKELVKIPEYNLLIDLFPECIKYLGLRTISESKSLIAESHFLAFFRRDNLISNAGFPTKFVESLGCSTPVFTNYVGDITNYIINQNNSIAINILNSDEIFDALLFISKMTNEQYRSMRKGAYLTGKQFHFKNFSADIHNFLLKTNDSN